jgi:adenylate kinase family enzyme
MIPTATPARSVAIITREQLSRVAIVGTSCAGKSTLAASLAECLDVPRIDLDALYWGPNWTPSPPEEFRNSVDQATSQLRWICAGNYRVVRDLVWQRATAVIWLDYSFPVVFGRALRRTLSRCLRRTPVFGGNRETFRKSFFSQDSILLWVVQTHGRNRKAFPLEFQEPEHAHLSVVRLRSVAATSRFQAEVRQMLAQARLALVADSRPNLID